MVNDIMINDGMLYKMRVPRILQRDIYRKAVATPTPFQYLILYINLYANI